MKITEALSNVITEAGGTPTAEDGQSVTHALGTLYSALGGEESLPNNVAERINSLSDYIGGGGLEFAEVTIRIDGIDASATAQGIDGVGLFGPCFTYDDSGQILFADSAFYDDNAIYKMVNGESSGKGFYPKGIPYAMNMFEYKADISVFGGTTQYGDLAKDCYIEMTSQNCLDEETMTVISDGYIGYTLYFGD